MLGCLLALGLSGLYVNASDAASLQPMAHADECVVLLHGMGRRRGSMRTLDKALIKTGYTTINLTYPSRHKTVEALAASVIPDRIERCEALGAERIHFVTHSLGGIVLRYYAAQASIGKLGHVVMLSPPNQGSELVGHEQVDEFTRNIGGPASHQLGTDSQSIPMQLGPVDFTLGVITGDRPMLWDTFFSSLIPGGDDGKVSVERARVEGMTDFLVLPYSHTFIMTQPEVIHQVLYFLQAGRFDHAAAQAIDRDASLIESLEGEEF